MPASVRREPGERQIESEHAAIQKGNEEALPTGQRTINAKDSTGSQW
jgi:hypothetical protein